MNERMVFKISSSKTESERYEVTREEDIHGLSHWLLAVFQTSTSLDNKQEVCS